jgi:hypothetical protein
MARRRASAPPSAASRLLGFVLVLAGTFVLPAALFFRLSHTVGSTRVAVQIVALILPATGALILQMNPDLVPDRRTLAALSPLAWVALIAVAVGLVTVVWSTVGALAHR